MSVSPTQNSGTKVDLSKQIYFKLPKGWSKESKPQCPKSGNCVVVSSPDLVRTCCGAPGKVPSVSIYFGKQIPTDQPTLDELDYNQYYNEIYKEILDPHQGGATDNNLTKTSIRGFPAIEDYYNFEGYQYNIYIWFDQKKAWSWIIGISAVSPKDGQQHQTDIALILFSIKFPDQNPTQASGFGENK